MLKRVPEVGNVMKTLPARMSVPDHSERYVAADIGGRASVRRRA